MGAFLCIDNVRISMDVQDVMSQNFDGMLIALRTRNHVASSGCWGSHDTRKPKQCMFTRKHTARNINRSAALALEKNYVFAHVEKNAHFDSIVVYSCKKRKKNKIGINKS